MMIDLKQNEVWFVTGSQHLYGPKTLETVAEHSRTIAAALGDFKTHADQSNLQTRSYHTGSYPRFMFGGQFFQELYRSDYMDAHFLAREDVDCRFEPAQETFCTLAHTIQP